MSKHIGPVVCLLIMMLDIVAGILGIQAEITQNKVKNQRVWIFDCREPSHEAFKLGLAALVLLCLAHTIANFFGGCVCICSKQDLQRATANKPLAVGFLIFSWIILAMASTMLIIGTLANLRSRKTCALAHHRLLSIGGIVCFIHGIFMVAYYLSASAYAREDKRKMNPQAPHA
ncbi:unnamed protein product [Camellia sinensis]|uniref:Uncharacterized protein n=1 Tax=Camellia sinensis var. sinensis TaxID=542762 RepID=A0A4S4EVQ3_CAMSN|nr:uncharacterized protein LOC114259125 [Camellia sinensis]THG21051.1 hypothetical protein TEA_020536 [Camellia sinensis var. sinensis]